MANPKSLKDLHGAMAGDGVVKKSFDNMVSTASAHGGRGIKNRRALYNIAAAGGYFTGSYQDFADTYFRPAHQQKREQQKQQLRQTTGRQQPASGQPNPQSEQRPKATPVKPDSVVGQYMPGSIPDPTQGNGRQSKSRPRQGTGVLKTDAQIMRDDTLTERQKQQLINDNRSRRGQEARTFDKPAYEETALNTGVVDEVRNPVEGYTDTWEAHHEAANTPAPILYDLNGDGQADAARENYVNKTANMLEADYVKQIADEINYYNTKRDQGGGNTTRIEDAINDAYTKFVQADDERRGGSFANRLMRGLAYQEDAGISDAIERGMLRERYSGLDAVAEAAYQAFPDEVKQKYGEDVVRDAVYQATFAAMQENARPKNFGQYLGQKLTNTVPGILYKAAVRANNGGRTTLSDIGDMATAQYEEGLEGFGGTMQQIAGEVLPMVLDPYMKIPVGGLAGGKAGQIIAKRAAAKAAQRGLESGAAKMAGQAALSKFVNRGIVGAASTAAQMAAYEEAMGLASMANGSGQSFWQVTGDALLGGLKMAPIGFIAPAARALKGRTATAIADRGLGKTANWAAMTGAKVGINTAAFITEAGVFAAPDIAALAINGTYTNERAKDIAIHSIANLAGFKAAGWFSPAHIGQAASQFKAMVKGTMGTELALNRHDAEALKRLGYPEIQGDNIMGLFIPLGERPEAKQGGGYFSHYSQIVLDERVPWSTRAKLMYIATGMLPETGVRPNRVGRSTDENGRTVITTYQGNNPISQRFFDKKHETSAESFYRKTFHDVEKMQYEGAKQDIINESIGGFGRSKLLGDAMAKKPNERTPQEQSMVDTFNEMLEDAQRIAEAENLRVRKVDRLPDPEKALQKPREERTEQERRAVERYYRYLNRRLDEIRKGNYEPIARDRAQEDAEAAAKEMSNKDGKLYQCQLRGEEDVWYTVVDFDGTVEQAQDGTGMSITLGESGDKMMVRNMQTGEAKMVTRDNIASISPDTREEVRSMIEEQMFNDNLNTYAALRRRASMYGKQPQDAAVGEHLTLAADEADAATGLRPEYTVLDRDGKSGTFVVEDADGNRRLINGHDIFQKVSDAGRVRTEHISTEDLAARTQEEVETIDGANPSGLLDPRTMSQDEKQKRGELLRTAQAIEIAPNQIVSTKDKSARKVAEEWWDTNVGEAQWYDTEVGEVEINRNSVESSLAHRYGQMKLDAITSLVEGFSNAVYLGSMPDSTRQKGVMNHYFAYPIMYNGKRCYVFCRALHDNNTNRLYVHEVFVDENIKRGNTHQTAASQPHGGIALYRDILANVLDSGNKGSAENPISQGNGGEILPERGDVFKLKVGDKVVDAEVTGKDDTGIIVRYDDNGRVRTEHISPEDLPARTQQPEAYIEEEIGSETSQAHEEYSARIRDWLSEENLEWAEGKTREEIFARFGNELEPIATIPQGYLRHLGTSGDNKVYSGKGYFIDHAVNHHDEEPVEEYLKLQEILNSPDDVKLDTSKGRPTLLFIKKYGKYYVEMVSVGEDGSGRVVLHKSFFHRKKMPHKGLPSVALEGPSADEVPAISPSSVENEAGSSGFSALDGSDKGSGNALGVQGNGGENSPEVPQDVPRDWRDDVPAEARKRGYIMDGAGGKIVRQEPFEEPKGHATQVNFGGSTGVVEAKYDIVESGTVQESHVNGQENPLHFFIREAQPKERTDKASQKAANTTAANIRPEEITSGATAYSGAPVVNARREVIQGNGRENALHNAYANGTAAEYRQYLIDHAEDWGLDPEAVRKMERPQLVRVIDVPDERAIELGLMDDKDIGTGGKQYVDPKTLIAKIDSGLFNRLMQAAFEGMKEEDSFADALRQNGKSLIDMLHANGHINETQLVGLMNADGTLTKNGRETLTEMVLMPLFDGAPANLRAKWDSPAIPERAKTALIKRLARLSRLEDKSVIGDIRKAVALLYEMRDVRDANTWEKFAHKFNEWGGQVDMQHPEPVGKDYTPDQVRMAGAIKFVLQKKLERFFGDIYNEMYKDSLSLGFGDMGGKPKSEAYKAAFEGIADMITPEHIKDFSAKPSEGGESAKPSGNSDGAGKPAEKPVTPSPELKGKPASPKGEGEPIKKADSPKPEAGKPAEGPAKPATPQSVERHQLTADEINGLDLEQDIKEDAIDYLEGIDNLTTQTAYETALREWERVNGKGGVRADGPHYSDGDGETEKPDAVPEQERELRDAVVGLMRGAGIEVSTDWQEGQRMLDASKRAAKVLDEMKKSAPETASVPNSEHQHAVISIAEDGAKIIQNLETLTKQLENISGQRKNFIGEVGDVLGAQRFGSASRYATFETANGDVVTIRLADHNAHTSGFDNEGKDNGISIVVSAKRNGGINNDGKAHVVEYYYDAIKLRKAEGHPYASIVRSLQQALYSGEYKDTTGLAERQEVNDDVIREMRVYHGSGADFDRFDHSHMGEGEGAQAYGWGTYVTEVEGIGKTYAERVSGARYKGYQLEDLDVSDSPFTGSEAERKVAALVLRAMRNTHDFADAVYRARTYLMGYYTKAASREKWRLKDYMERMGLSRGGARDAREDTARRIAKYRQMLDTLSALDENDFTQSQRVLYAVEIPDAAEAYYIDYDGRMNAQREVLEMVDNALHSAGWRRQEVDGLVRFGKDGKQIVLNPNQTGADLYMELADGFGSPRAASEFLGEAGITGIKYPADYMSGGREDGASNYVIFDEADLRITDKIKFFRTADGETYGFTQGGKVYVDPRVATSETPIHEYHHLWAEALEKANPEAWAKLKQELFKDKDLREWVKKLYPELAGDENALAHELFAHFGGRRGAERLRAEQERMERRNKDGVFGTARIVTMFHRLAGLVRNYWQMARELFAGNNARLKDMSAEDFADMAMSDLLNKVDPGKQGRRGDDSEKPAGEKPARSKPKAVGPKDFGDIDLGGLGELDGLEGMFGKSETNESRRAAKEGDIVSDSSEARYNPKVATDEQNKAVNKVAQVLAGIGRQLLEKKGFRTQSEVIDAMRKIPQIQETLDKIGFDDEDKSNLYGSMWGKRIETPNGRKRLSEYADELSKADKTKSKSDDKPKQIVSPMAPTVKNVVYKPNSKGKTNESIIPAAMAQAVKKALGKINGGDTDGFVLEKAGFENADEMYEALNAEQIDGVALAIAAIERGEGIILGDMTGIGKGRQLATVIRYARKQGIRPVFVTEKPGLFKDMMRDLLDVGADKPNKPFRPLILASGNNGDVTASDGSVVKAADAQTIEKLLDGDLDKLAKDYDALFVTYSNTNNVNPDAFYADQNVAKKEKTHNERTETKEPPELTKKKLNLIAKWARGGIVIMDEAHNAAGTDSAQGVQWREIIDTTSGVNAKGVVMASATYAKTPRNYVLYALRTPIKEAHLSNSELLETFTKGGVPLQEWLAGQLTGESYIRRERDMTGVNFDYRICVDGYDAGHPENSTPEALEKVRAIRNSNDKAAKISNIMLALDNKAGETFKKLKEVLCPGKGQKGGAVQVLVQQADGTWKEEFVNAAQYPEPLKMSRSGFASEISAVNAQLFMAEKAESAADAAIMALKNGELPMIVFENTFDSLMNDLPVDDQGALESVDYAQAFVRYLDQLGNFTIKLPKKNANGAQEILKCRINLSGDADFLMVKRMIESEGVGLHVSPVDRIRERIEAAGYKVGELSGRKHSIQKLADGKYHRVSRKSENADKVTDDYNTGKIDVLLINASGSTGRSMHAKGQLLEDGTEKPGLTQSGEEMDMRPRHQIYVQNFSNETTMVQAMGRIDRTGQTKHGRYTFLMTPVPAETNILMRAQRKREQLKANTTAQQDRNSFDAVNASDFINKYGDEVVAEYLEQNPKICAALQIPKDKLRDGGRAIDGLAKRATANAYTLTCDQQQGFYDDVQAAYDEYVKVLKENGDYDLETQVVDLQAETLAEHMFVRGSHESDSMFSQDTNIARCRVKVQRKPMKMEEIEQHIADVAGTKSRYERQEKWQEKFDEHFDGMEAEVIREFEAKERNVDNDGKKNDKLSRIRAFRAEAQRLVNDFPLDLLMPFYADTSEVNDAQGKIATADSMPHAIVYDIKLGRTLGSSTIVFAVNDGRQKVSVRMNDDAAFRYLRRLQVMPAEKFDRGEWDKSQGDTFEDAFIITGNLIGAYHSPIASRGRMIRYTDSEGNQHTGILMPRNFKTSDVTVERPISEFANRLVQYARYGATSVSLPVFAKGELDVEESRKYSTLRFAAKGELAKSLANDPEMAAYRTGKTTNSYEVKVYALQEVLNILAGRYGVSASVPVDPVHFMTKEERNAEAEARRMFRVNEKIEEVQHSAYSPYKGMPFVVHVPKERRGNIDTGSDWFDRIVEQMNDNGLYGKTANKREFAGSRRVYSEFYFQNKAMAEAFVRLVNDEPVRPLAVDEKVEAKEPDWEEVDRSRHTYILANPGQPITNEDIAKTFGFRNVDTGRTSADGVRDLYNAFMTMAMLLNIHPTSLSLGGNMDIAMTNNGDRELGDGTVAAFKVSGKTNSYAGRTQKKLLFRAGESAFPLAHEWLHALDNYFGTHGLKNEATGFYEQTRQASENADRETRPWTARPEMREAWVNLLKALTESGFYGRLENKHFFKGSNFTDSSERPKYWGKRTEMIARAFEPYLRKKISENEENLRIVTGDSEAAELTRRMHDMISQGKESTGGPFDPTPEEQKILDKAFDNLFEAVKEKRDTDTGRVIMYEQAKPGETKREATMREARNLNRVLAKTGLAKSVVVESEREFAEGVLAKTGKPLRDLNGTIYGYTDAEGNIHLNAAHLNFETPIHEYGHLWAAWARKNHADLWQRGIELAKQSDAFKRLKQEAQSEGSVYRGMGDDQLADEVLADAIGKKGESMYDEKEWTRTARMRHWLTQLWHRVGEALGLRKRLPNQAVGDMSFDDIVRNAAGDLLGGKRLKNAKTEETRFMMGDSPESFKSRQQRAVENKGVVMPGLNEAVVRVVDVPRHGGGKLHPFDENLRASELKKQVREYARTHGDEILGDVDFNGGKVKVTLSSIDEMVDPKSIKNSVDKEKHLAAITKIKGIISSSIDTEVHPDYIEKDEAGNRLVGRNNEHVLLHRLYGAVNIDGTIYRVKTTIKEDNTNGVNKAYTYEVTNIELLEDHKGAADRPPRTTNSSISAAKLLHGVEKSYEKGKRLLDESGNTTESGRSGELSYQQERDPKQIAKWDKELEGEEGRDFVVAYHAMQLLPDGRLVPPMTGEYIDHKTGKRTTSETFELGGYTRADEHPELIVQEGPHKGKYPLRKFGESGVTYVAYDPYLHGSNIAINDQFKSAWRRPDVVMVEVHIPMSELQSGYQAEGALLPVGVHNWHKGVVASKFKGDTRKVALTRAWKNIRILEDWETANMIAPAIKRNGITVPENVFSPKLRAELERRGVQFGAPEKGMEKNRPADYDVQLEKARAEIDESKVDSEERYVSPMRFQVGSPQGNAEQLHIAKDYAKDRTRRTTKFLEEVVENSISLRHVLEDIARKSGRGIEDYENVYLAGGF